MIFIHTVDIARQWRFIIVAHSAENLQLIFVFLKILIWIVFYFLFSCVARPMRSTNGVLLVTSAWVTRSSKPTATFAKLYWTISGMTKRINYVFFQCWYFFHLCFCFCCKNTIILMKKQWSSIFDSRCAWWVNFNLQNLLVFRLVHLHFFFFL